MKKKLWSTVLILAIVIVGAWYINKNFIQITNVLPKPNSIKVEDTKNIGGQLIVVVDNELISLESEKIQNMYSDKNEVNKIINFGGLTKDGKSILAFVKEAGLTQISLDGTKSKKVLNEDFGPSKIIASQNGTKIALVTFSNAEKDYGYSIIVVDADGQKPQTVLEHAGAIAAINWLDDSNLVYTEVANDTISINKVNIQTLKTSLIYGAANKNPYGLTVLKDKLIVSLSSEDKDETKLVEMDIKGNITKEIVSEKGIIYYPTVSKDQTKIAYLVKNTISTDLPGTVYTTDFLGKNKQKITDASQIIAWQ